MLPDNVTQERRQLLALFGAEIIDSPGQLGSNGAVALAKQLVERDDRASSCPTSTATRRTRAPTRRPRPRRSSPTAPRSTSSWPAWAPAGRSWASGGGCARHNPDVRIYAAEPLPGEQVQGLRSLDEGFIPEIFDPSRARREAASSPTRESIEALRELTEREGIFAGVSCGAVLVAAAQQVAREMDHGTIVALLADGGWKYLSAGTFWPRPRRDGRRPRGRRQLVVAT